MELSALSALSPLDGRYFKRIKALRPILSEYGYMRYRVLVELKWFMSLTQMQLPEVKPLSTQAQEFLNRLVEQFTQEDAARIKDIEAITNHDVKAVEYWIKESIGLELPPQLDALQRRKVNVPKDIVDELRPMAEFIHFACTSEDINNTSHGMMIRDAKEQVILPAIDKLIQKLQEMAHRYATVAMLARTHGQTATPTTLGKELANFVARMRRIRKKIDDVEIMGKMNGAVGNFNAHYVAYPDVNWEEFAKNVVEKQLGLTYNAYTVQIEPHDYIAEIFDEIARFNTVLIDFNRDIWSYISLGYLKQTLKAGEVGSSTMPHKVNPIDFENSEGNLGLANALLKHMSAKLPISRWQRDLTDSTVLRNIGIALGYGLVAYDSCLRGLNKLEVNQDKIAEDLVNAWEVLAEPIQTVMRRYGIENPYEQLKLLTRGKEIDKKDLHEFVYQLKLSQSVKEELLKLTPEIYTGIASVLAKKI